MPNIDQIWKGETTEDSGFTAVNAIQVNGADVQQADLSAITYEIYDRGNPGGAATTTGTAITVSAAVFNARQTDGYWTLDKDGYNFRFQIPASALPDVKVYRALFKFTPASGEVFHVKWDVTVKDKTGN